MKFDRNSLLLLAPAIYLFVLPIPHTTALRNIVFGISVLILLATWRRAPSPPVPLKAPFTAWFALALVSLIGAIHLAFSIREIRSEIVFGILTFLIFFRSTRSDRELNFWFLTLAASALAVGTFALVHFQRGLDPYDVGTYGGTLHYAAYLNTIFPALAAVAILRAGWRRLLIICLMAFLLVTAYGSTSRAVWVGFLLESMIFGGLYLNYMGVRPNVRKIAIVASLGVFVLLSGALLYVAKEKRNLTGGPLEIIAQTLESDRRPQLWADSFAFIRERPVTGAGFGRMVLGEQLVEQQKDRHHSHAHNILLNYALQLGLLGPIVIAFVFWSVGRELWKLVRSRRPDHRILGIAAISIIGGTFAQCMIEDVFVQHMALQFWALMGIVLGYYKHGVREAAAEGEGPAPG